MLFCVLYGGGGVSGLVGCVILRVIRRGGVSVLGVWYFACYTKGGF